MNQKPPTFRDELKAYQQRLEALALKEPHKHERNARRILGRWLANHRCEEVWDKLKPRLPAVLASTPGLFIATVITFRNEAENMRDLIHEMPAVKSTLKRNERQRLKKREFVELAAENVLLDNVEALRARVLGREKTGPRMFFMRRLSASFEYWCGQPLDDVVGILTGIAFNLEKEISAEAVRKARKAKA